jgi:hypothetical protein
MRIFTLTTLATALAASAVIAKVGQYELSYGFLSAAVGVVLVVNLFVAWAEG